MKKKILIVEDDTLLRGLLAEKLIAEGFDVLFAETVTNALKELENKPDEILLDLLLPEGSGIDVLRAARVDPDLRLIPIIVFSNLSEESSIVEAKNLGATEYIIKSNLGLKELVRILKNHLEEN